MPRFSQLTDWLAWQEGLHSTEIDLGLDRVYLVAQRLRLFLNVDSAVTRSSGALAIGNTQVITVAGTNGKGSCVTMIEQCLLAQHNSVGTYTSPHIHHYCERVRVNGRAVSESLMCDAFAVIDEARGNISLTYFEFSTLAALWIFVQKQLPFVVLEVGLGGRLDAVNIVDADVAVVTSIAVDHEAWLGNDREQIAREKLGVTRVNKPVVIAETDLTQSLKDFIRSHDPVYCIQQHFTVSNLPYDDLSSMVSTSWLWSPDCRQAFTLPLPKLPLTSVAAALQVLFIIHRLPALHMMITLLETVGLAGRFEQRTIQGRQVIFDVAHNPAAACLLATRLSHELTSNFSGRVYAVFSAMADKNLAQIVEPLEDMVAQWYVSDLSMPRAASVEQIVQALDHHQQVVNTAQSIEQAWEMALTEATEHDRIIVFGSFVTVAAIQDHMATEWP